MPNVCSFDGCDTSEKLTKGLCRKHYMRLWRNGDPSIAKPPGVPGTSRKHPLYGAVAGMINRCHNPNNSAYARYGARGIYVCDRWRFGEDGKSGFECFLEDMGERPDGHTLDRIDPYGSYTPENCRWATHKVQRSNMTKEGDARTRAASSSAMKAYWDRRRKI